MNNNPEHRQSDGDPAKLIYELSQQSAEHHDNLLWEVSYIIWGSSTLLLGFVLEAIRQEPLLSLVTACLSIFMTMMAWRLATEFRKVRNRKYDVCHQIEAALEMRWKQHTDLGPDYRTGVQTWWHRATNVFFIVVWLCVAFRSLYLLLCAKQ